MLTKEKILLHTCCGPCASGCIERLQNDNYQVIMYFANDNIDTQEEYQKRLENAIKVANYFKIELIQENYNHQSWLNEIKGLEKEPEKGGRCTKCFNHSFKQSSEKAQDLKISKFCTTLTVSPHKNSKIIKEAGNTYNNYLHYDFKKKNGYKRSLLLSKELNLYRQNYCACEFSK